MLDIHSAVGSNPLPSRINLNARIDLLGDFVVLFCWRFSRKPASDRYPFGYGKYESIGSLAVSMLLLLGAAGIGQSSPLIVSLT